MKIIAATNTTHFLAEVNIDEIAHIMGHDGQYSEDFKKDQVKIGTEVPVQGISKLARYVRTMDQKNIKAMETQLGLIMEKVQELRSTVNRVNFIEILKGDESEVR